MLIATTVFIGCALIFGLALYRAKEYRAERSEIIEQSQEYVPGNHGC